MENHADVAVLIPCYNEEITVAKVVSDFKRALPDAAIYVFDNCSTDQTAARARAAGANVIYSPRPGKGHVVRHMFDSIEAKLYIMADGDDTYPADHAPQLIAKQRETQADMVVGTRFASYHESAFRRFHVFGNKLVARLISMLFNTEVSDVLSGYRVFSRDFVKSVPLLSGAFEIETEMTLQAAAKSFLIKEVPVPYGQRPEGSVSKLSTFSDGFLVLRALFFIFKDFRPLVFFSSMSALLMITSLGIGLAPILDYYRYKYVYKVPLAILAASVAILAALSFVVGVILDTIRTYHDEDFVLARKMIRKG